MATRSYWCNCSGGFCHPFWKCVQQHPDRACQNSLSRGSASTSSRLWMGREYWQRSRPSLTTPVICSIRLLLHRGMRLAFGCSLHSVLSYVLFHCCCQVWLESFLLHFFYLQYLLVNVWFRTSVWSRYCLHFYLWTLSQKDKCRIWFLNVIFLIFAWFIHD